MSVLLFYQEYNMDKISLFLESKQIKKIPNNIQY